MFLLASAGSCCPPWPIGGRSSNQSYWAVTRPCSSACLGLSLALPSHHRLPAFGVCFTCISYCLGLPDVGNLHHSRCRDILPFCCCKQETNCTARKTIHHFVITFPFQRLPFQASLWPKLPLISKRRTGRKMSDKEGEELEIGL